MICVLDYDVGMYAGSPHLRQAGVQQDQGAVGGPSEGHPVGGRPPVPPGPGFPASHHVLPRLPGIRPHRDLRRILHLRRRAGIRAPYLLQKKTPKLAPLVF